MSAALKQPVAAVATREESATPLLDDILARVTVIEAKQSRPAPVQLRTWEEIERFAEKAARSGMVPKDFIGKPDAICIAVQMGSELGLAPMQALQNIAVVNGRPSLWGDALPGLCRASGVCKTMREWSDGEGEGLTFYCEAIRRDDPNPVIASFSVADAKRAGLWKEKATVTKRSRDGGTYEADSGPWYSYPKRMLQMRARGFALRDAFPDVLKGLITVEEARDIPFEETGLTPRMPEATREQSTMAEQIGDGLPEHSAAPVKRTLADVISELEQEFAAAESRDGVDEVLASEKCQKALDYARNGAKAKLQAIIKAATDRTAAPIDNAPENATDDIFPGDLPSRDAA
jgi:hypothetical protein